MQQIDWIILIITLLFIVIYGVWKTKGSTGNVKDYILGNNETPWWTVGLSVMATQASAITFLSTPGQAYHDGMGFVQFYFGLPIAMVVISMTFIPIYHKLKVFTAYEYLEERFDLKTRSLASILFLVQRGLGTGITLNYSIVDIGLEFNPTEYYYWFAGNYLHVFWGDQGCKRDAETPNVCHYVWNDCHLFLDFTFIAKRHDFWKCASHCWCK
jgi:hypothetical protein